MAAVRAEAIRMADAGEAVVMQRGRVVNGREARGAIRIGRADHARADHAPADHALADDARSDDPRADIVRADIIRADAAPVDSSQTAYAKAYRGVNFREHPELYRIGRGEQGVLIAEPYKSELLPLWRFKTEAIARTSAGLLWKAFLAYRRSRDFVGMDMTRKFLQMGFTRARRYANHASGRKFASADKGRPRELRAKLPLAPDTEKAKAAAVFYDTWQKAERDKVYAAWRRRQRGADTAKK